MVEPNGRLKLHPTLAFSIITYLLGIGVACGMLLAQVSALRAEVSKLNTQLSGSVRSRAEGDIIIKDFDARISRNDRDIDKLDSRMLVVERRGR